MIGGLFAGVEESPGETTMIGDRPMKRYRGMGSLSAMATRSYAKDRYSQELVVDPDRSCPRASRATCPSGDRSAGSTTSSSGSAPGDGLLRARTITQLREQASPSA